MKKYIILLAGGIVILAVIVFYAWQSKQGQILGEREVFSIKIGAILPLTGRGAVYGEQWQKGLVLAVERINNSQGVSGRKLELIFEDNQADTKLSVAAFEKLTKFHGVKIVFSGMSNITAALAPPAEENQVILFGAATTNQYAEAFGFVFKDYLDIYNDCKILAKKYSDKKISLLGLNRDTTILCEKALEEVLGNIDAYLYESGEKDFRTQLLKIKTNTPDFLMVRVFQDDLVSILKQAKELGIKIPLMCPVIEHACSFLDAIQIAPGLFENAVGTGFALDQEFSSETIYFFDDMNVVAAALKKCEGDEDMVCVKNKIIETKNYSGVAGDFSFNDKGISVRPVKLLEFRDGKWLIK